MVTVIVTAGVADADIIMDGTTTMGSESRLATQWIRSVSAAFLQGWPLAHGIA
jgi:hypothetical protein